MFMLQCDEYQESYDDEQNEIDWQFVCQYEDDLIARQDAEDAYYASLEYNDSINDSYASSEMDEDWLNHQEQFATQEDYIDYLIQCNAID